MAAKFDEYLDIMGQLCRLMKDGKAQSSEAKYLEGRLTTLWAELNEEEQIQADETTLRTRLWMGV